MWAAMEKRFIIPASTFLGGIIVWLILFFEFISENLAVWQELLIGIITGGLIVISAYRCKRAKGPKAGNLFRAGILLILAIFTFWKIGTIAAIVLAASVAFTLLIALGSNQRELNSN
jgi:hypothetical protein